MSVHKLNLVFRNTERKGERIAVEAGRFIIGRHSSCQLVLSGNAVSRRHCAVIREGDDVVLRDLGSRNGSAVNKKRIAREGQVSIFHGDKIQIGNWKLRVSIRDAETGRSIPRPAEGSAKETVDSDRILAELDSMLSGMETILSENEMDFESISELARASSDPDSDSEFSSLNLENLSNDAIAEEQTEVGSVQSDDVTNVQQASQDAKFSEDVGNAKDDSEDDKKKSAQRYKKLPDHLRQGKTGNSQYAASQALKRLFGG
ncbi:MAG: FHA domain-containing protein [Pirellulaceae bacterium]